MAIEYSFDGWIRDVATQAAMMNVIFEEIESGGQPKLYLTGRAY